MQCSLNRKERDQKEMFQKEQIKEFLRELNLDPNEYCLIAGGSLVMHGIKQETEDIDLCVSEKGFQYLHEHFQVQKSTKNYPNLYEVTENLEVVLDTNWNQKICWIEKIPCNSILEEYQWKKEKNREKDQEILMKLEKFLKQVSQYYQCLPEELTEQKIQEYQNIRRKE